NCRRFTTSKALEPVIVLLSVVALTLLNLRGASRRPDATKRPATDLVDSRYVAVRSAWRYKKNRRDRTVQDFFYALARQRRRPSATDFSKKNICLTFSGP